MRMYLKMYAASCLALLMTSGLVLADHSAQGRQLLGRTLVRQQLAAEEMPAQDTMASDEYLYMKELMNRQANIKLVQNMLLKAVDDAVPKTLQKRTRICLPSTDCDFEGWGDEADAKDLLMPGRDTNPGRRRRSLSGQHANGPRAAH
ncbi:hypothetical protein HDE_04592 [Halotydeus destructor]|nr:hypothetical protein HDE_04592 [Halotydeus destructor]